MEQPAGTHRPELSVIIPALNEGDILKGTLSYLRQELAGVHDEVNVVDNGSIDETAEIAREAEVLVISATGIPVGVAEEWSAQEARADVPLSLHVAVTVTSVWSEFILGVASGF